MIVMSCSDKLARYILQKPTKLQAIAIILNMFVADLRGLHKYVYQKNFTKKSRSFIDLFIVDKVQHVKFSTKK